MQLKFQIKIQLMTTHKVTGLYGHKTGEKLQEPKIK